MDEISEKSICLNLEDMSAKDAIGVLTYLAVIKLMEDAAKDEGDRAFMKMLYREALSTDPHILLRRYKRMIHHKERKPWMRKYPSIREKCEIELALLEEDRRAYERKKFYS